MRPVGSVLFLQVFSCNYVAGRYPQESRTHHGLLSTDFPAQMDTEALFPVDFSKFTTTDGNSYEVPCTILTNVDVDEFVCPVRAL